MFFRDGATSILQSFSPCRTILIRVLVGAQPTALQIGLGNELCVPSEHDVRSTTRHVRSNGDCTLSASHSDDLSFTLVFLRVENLTGDAPFLEHLCNQFRFFN